MSGGGKGGSQTSTVQIPGYIEDAAKANLARADEISKIGYTPYYGPDVAALTPMQEAAMQNTAAAASAFGLGAPTGQGVTGMPAATEYAGGIRGYSSAPLYEQSLEQLAANRPGQYNALMAPFLNPATGEGPSAPFGRPLVEPTSAGPVSNFQERDDGGDNGISYGSVGPGGLIGPQQDLPGNMVTRSLGIGAGAKTDDGGYAGKSGDGCFLTTAIVDRRGEADDGPTLSKLRNFRDTYMSSDPEMAEDIARYYDVAPQIVATIPEGDPDWDWIGSQVDKSINHIDANELSEAYDVYGSMVKKLMSKWIDAKGSY